MNILKIGVSGTHGCQKSTIIRELYSILTTNECECAVVEETARRIPPELKLNEDTNLITQEYIYSSQKIKEIEAFITVSERIKANKKQGIIITDRTVFDVIPYLMYTSKQNTDILHSGMMIYNDCIRYNDLRGYDLIYFIRPSHRIPIEDDGVRSTDKYYQMDIDMLFLSLFSGLQNKIKIVEVPHFSTQNLERRLSLVTRGVIELCPNLEEM